MMKPRPGRQVRDSERSESECGAPSPPRYAAEGLGDSAILHQVEHAVRRELLAEPHLRFASLVVRRINDGVCLQGVLEADEDSPDVSTIAQRVDGVHQVLNRLVVTPRIIAAKG